MTYEIDNRTVKWGYATHALRRHDLFGDGVRLAPVECAEPPQPDDVIVAEVVEIRHHERIELPEARSSTLFLGDRVGVAYGHRYATRQFHGTVPDNYQTCHLLSVAGVCGQVMGMSPVMDDPTLLRPIGRPLDPEARPINLRQFGLKPLPGGINGATTVLVVGSTMDAGKTTIASSIVNGLTRAGANVAAGKLTGTGSAKDLMLMKDAGATRALDFTDIGHASTAGCSRHDLANIVATLRSQLAADGAEYVVLEIADGIVQRETEMLLQLFQVQQSIDYVLYCCCDSLGVIAGVERLRQYGLNLAAVSGLAAYTALAATEARGHTNLPVPLAEELRDPVYIARLLPRQERVTVQLAEVG